MFVAGPVSEDDFFQWEALVVGPEGTPYVSREVGGPYVDIIRWGWLANTEWSYLGCSFAGRRSIRRQVDLCESIPPQHDLLNHQAIPLTI